MWLDTFWTDCVCMCVCERERESERQREREKYVRKTRDRVKWRECFRGESFLSILSMFDTLRAKESQAFYVLL